MKTIFVPYNAGEAVSFRKKLETFRALRRQDGAYTVALKAAMQNADGNRKAGRVTDKARALVRFAFGRKISTLLLLERPRVLRPDKDAAPIAGELYHFAPVEDLTKIRAHGLQSKNRMVFLTDDVDFLLNEGYLQWKAQRRKKSMTFCVLRIDALRLQRSCAVRRIDRPHEFIAKKVPPQYIFWDDANIKS